jgi:hypothetical protein
MDRQEIEDALRREKGEKENGAMDGIFTNPWLEPIARELLDAMAESDDAHDGAGSPTLDSPIS